jgi:hypothetical protein
VEEEWKRLKSNEATIRKILAEDYKKKAKRLEEEVALAYDQSIREEKANLRKETKEYKEAKMKIYQEKVKKLVEEIGKLKSNR